MTEFGGPDACARCGEPYALRAGDDPTPHCDPCAHARVEELERERDAAMAQAEDIAKRQRQACADQFRDDDLGHWAAAIVRETKLVTDEEPSS